MHDWTRKYRRNPYLAFLVEQQLGGAYVSTVSRDVERGEVIHRDVIQGCLVEQQ